MSSAAWSAPWMPACAGMTDIGEGQNRPSPTKADSRPMRETWLWAK